MPCPSIIASKTFAVRPKKQGISLSLVFTSLNSLQKKFTGILLPLINIVSNTILTLITYKINYIISYQPVCEHCPYAHLFILFLYILEMICNADWVIDLGPGAGEHGGKIIFEGTLQELLNCKQSIIGIYLKRYLSS